jgi:hypothetical protein
MWDVIRAIPVCAITGKACGLIAAHNKDFTNVDVIKLQNILKNRNIPY